MNKHASASCRNIDEGINICRTCCELMPDIKSGKLKYSPKIATQKEIDKEASDIAKGLIHKS